jgi:hypothetical protein
VIAVDITDVQSELVALLQYLDIRDDIGTNNKKEYEKQKRREKGKDEKNCILYSIKTTYCIAFTEP